MKYDLHKIMCRAWALYRKGVAAFAECLHRAWSSAKAEPINAQRIEKAQQAAGVAEQVNTHGQVGKPQDMRSYMALRACSKRFLFTHRKAIAQFIRHRSLVGRKSSR